MPSPRRVAVVLKSKPGPRSWWRRKGLYGGGVPDLAILLQDRRRTIGAMPERPRSAGRTAARGR